MTYLPFSTHVDETVTRGLGPDQATSPRSALAGQDTLPAVLLGAVGTEEVANLTPRDTNVTGRYISVGANMLVQLAHESHAELSNLIVRLALGVEVCSTLSTSHGHCIESILCS